MTASIESRAARYAVSGVGALLAEIEPHHALAIEHALEFALLDRMDLAKQTLRCCGFDPNFIGVFTDSFEKANES